MKKNVLLIAALIGLILTVSFAGIISNSDLINKNKALKETIDNIKNQQPTLVFHVCEKGEGYSWGHLPNATDTYNQILTLDNYTHRILLLPEFQGHLNWTQELVWITDTFGGKNGVPIILDVFGGGNETSPIPMLTIEQISEVMAVANVQALRIAEVVSWHIGNHRVFPTDYLTSMLAFSKENNLAVFWTEWKKEGFTEVQNYTVDYQDTVTVSFSTNSGDLEPIDGFLYLQQLFPKWGASIQAWYWETNHDSNLENMRSSLLLEHSLSAKGLGANIIQFEPYWYFFDNGTANRNLELLLANMVKINV